ncbi:MAG: glucoamylase family protein, partial [Planctomycetota bacterium]
MPQKDELPLREELFNVEQLERHGEALARTHQLAVGKGPDTLIPRLSQNEVILIRAYELVTNAAKQKRRIAPAAEWLLDNFYLIEDQIRIARRHLPRSYSRELPRLANGVSANSPRAYGIALELISHVDGRIDAVSLNRFIDAYQSVTPLKLGELWALPIMLRLALIENLRRVAVRLAAGRRDQDLANDWAERMVLEVERNPTDLILVMADMARANPALSGAFLAEITRHLQGQSPYFAFANSWLEHRVAEQGLTIEQLVRAEGRAQAADQVSMGNSVSSLRFLSSHDWREFVETHSGVEQILRSDPAQIYPEMSFATRDHYRHIVEAIAKRSRQTESDVASKAIHLAKMAHPETTSGTLNGEPNRDVRRTHVGYYLVDQGRAPLERSVGTPLSLRGALVKVGRLYALPLYGLVVLLAAAGATAGFVAWARSDEEIPYLLLGIPFALCVVQLGIHLANWLASIFVAPRPLPRMDFQYGIPALERTMVVVPTLLNNAAGVENLLEALEVRFLANRDPHLHFALLTDLEDADQEVKPGDAELVRLASEGIERLNQKYSQLRSDIFFLFHRPRRWNAEERAWMGHERKRGKLADFNAYLRGSRDRFAAIVGDPTHLEKVRYVITLDTDTQLPRDSARQMVGAMAHPLNRPVIDAKRGRVCEGYGIMQPRVSVSLPSAQRSWFVRLFAGDAGLDPYTRVVSDLYQDLFGEGSFIGKGIYDVDAFEQCCGSFPDNLILSHDLLESAYARSALLSDVELYEDFPSRYPADVSRRHRWTRGDWQIAWWCTPWAPTAPKTSGGRWAFRRNPVSTLARWKIFDNLRRSVTPAALVVFLVSAWLLLPHWGVAATLFALAMVGLVPLLSTFADLVRKPSDVPPLLHLNAVARGFGEQIAPAFITLFFAPYDAYMSIDAIVRTLYRMFWSHERMLEWKTSSDAQLGAEAELIKFYRSMSIAPALAAMVFILMAVWHPWLLVAAGPLLGFWFVAPAIAWWLSEPLEIQKPQLTDKQQTFLRMLARQTWRFFEVYVTAEENWLPPDNYQEQPARGIASRTSPTNIGMAMLADLAALDFGYCSVGQMIDRIDKTLGTLARLDRFRGHFYNWYDTRSLKPLMPLYVSMVDSGNLVGHLLVLRSGLLELAEAPVLAPRIFAGLSDTAHVLQDTARGTHSTLVSGEARRTIERVQIDLAVQPSTMTATVAVLRRLITSAAEIVAAVRANPANAELMWWASAFERACKDHYDDLLHLAPWVAVTASPEQKLEAAPLQRLLDLRQALVRFDTSTCTLREMAASQQTLLPRIDAALADATGTAEEAKLRTVWLTQLRGAIVAGSQHAAARIAALQRSAQNCQEYADMDFLFLFDKSRDLFSIGFNVSDNRLDNSFYDLLASEARLGSFVVIAQDQIGQEHWFALGRLLTSTGGATALVSWSGSMFEYLMPMLVMPSYENTLLDQTCRAAVRRQINYGRQRGVPWGISESGYNTIDLHSNYQYRAFGVPGLGLKRGLAEDVVIAPYATALALMVAPEEACKNLERLAFEGQLGAFGMYEAIDYTPSRLPPGESRVTVRQFMAHHQGMSLLSLAYVLLDKPMQRRFEADPMLRAADLLLQERIPKACSPIFPHVAEASATRAVSAEDEGAMWICTDLSGPSPDAHLLSNGRYHVAITSAGGGYSRWRDLAVTRWREDATRDSWGTYCYLRDLDSGVLWSATMQPTLKQGKRYQAIFTQARAEFRRSDDRLDTHTEISVSPEDDIELRRTTITNRSKYARTIEITSYAEVVLALPSHDLAHPAFSNLFVQTELMRNRQAILCTRRPRSAEERPPWMMHLMTIRGTTVGSASFETDRMKFIGRGRTLAAPAAMEEAKALSNSEGPVLD